MKLKLIIFSLLPLILLIFLSESTLYFLNIGEPFKKTPQFHNELQILSENFDYIRLRPNASINKNEVLNRLGFRGNEFDTDADIKILCMGDSTTFGFGLENNSLSYPEQIEIMLKSESWDVSVLNAGVPAYTLYQGYNLYDRYLKQLADWDYVILTFGWNDNPEGELDLQYVFQNPIRPQYYNRIYSTARQFRTYNAIEKVFHKVRWSNKDEWNLTYEQYENNYENFIHELKSKKTTVIILPVLKGPIYDKSPIHNKIEDLNEIANKISNNKGAVFIPLNDFKTSEDIAWFDTYHYDEKGHNIIAKEIVEYIKKQSSQYP